MKKNKVLSVLLASLFIFITVFGSKNVLAKDQKSVAKITTKLSINSEYLTKIHENKIKKQLLDAQVQKFNNKADERASLLLNLDIKEAGAAYTVEGNSVLFIDGENYSFNVNGNLDTYSINNKTFYYGPVFGEMKNKQKNDSAIIALFYDPSSDTTIASLSVGDLGKDGVALLVFGENNPDYSALMNQLNSNNNNLVSTNSQPQLVKDASSEPSLAAASYSLSGGDYTYVSSSYSRWISDRDGYWQYEYAPPNSDILNYTSKYMVILDSYKGDLDNSAVNRVWTNTPAMMSYVGASFGGAYCIYSWFGSATYDINITNVGPADGTAITIPSWYDYIAKFLKVDGAWEYIKIIMNTYFQNTVNVARVPELQKKDLNWNRVYQDGKYIRYAQNQADVPYEPSDLKALAKLSGGASFNFDYTKYVNTGKQFTSGAQVVYNAFADNYNFFLWSDKVYNSWSQ